MQKEEGLHKEHSRTGRRTKIAVITGINGTFAVCGDFYGQSSIKRFDWIPE